MLLLFGCPVFRLKHFRESSGSLANSSNLQPTYRLLLTTCCFFCILLITTSIFLVSLHTEPISSRDFASSSFANCSKLDLYRCLFPLFRNDAFTSFFSCFCFRVWSSLWFFNLLSSVIVLIYDFSSKSAPTTCS